MRLASRERYGVEQRSSCAEGPDERSQRGADPREPPPGARSNGAVKVNGATPSETKAGIAASAGTETAGPSNGSGFKKKLNDDLSEAFSLLDPGETPWFGIDLDNALLAIAPHGITVAEIIDPPGIQRASIHKSLFPEGPWLLTTADGTDIPIDNPVTKAKQAMRSVEDRLKTFLTNQGKSPRVKVRGVAVFPDGYDLNAANERHALAEESREVRVINASELPKELLKPLHSQRLSPALYRNWLRASVLRDPNDDSVALTWLDPNGETISRRVRALGARNPLEDYRTSPPMTNEVLADAALRPSTRKAGNAIAAGFSLVLGLSVYALWKIYVAHEPTSEQLLDRRVLEQDVPRPVLPGHEDSAAAQPPKRKEAPERKDSSTFKNLDPPANRADLTDSTIADTDPPNAVLPMEKNFELGPSEPTAAWRKTVEHKIDKAIQLRAVDGVVVVFVNDTAYLTGAVLSEKQKAAAEEAARNVTGVKRVQSSISVKWGRMADG